MYAMLAAAAESEPSKTFFYVAGGLLVAWAVGISVLGMARPGFPGKDGSRVVMAASAALVALVVFATIATN